MVAMVTFYHRITGVGQNWLEFRYIFLNFRKAWLNSAWHRAARSIANLFCVFCLSILVLPGICAVSSVIFFMNFLWFCVMWRVSRRWLGSIEVIPWSYKVMAALYADESGSVVMNSASSPAPDRSKRPCFAHCSSLPMLVAIVMFAKHFPTWWHSMLKPFLRLEQSLEMVCKFMIWFLSVSFSAKR